MRVFEVSKRYYESGMTYEITKRTAKTVWFNAIQHAGRFNETIMKEGKSKIRDWKYGEAFFDGARLIEA